MGPRRVSLKVRRGTEKKQVCLSVCAKGGSQGLSWSWKLHVDLAAGIGS